MFYQEEPGLTYDDVLLMPDYSEVLPSDVTLKSRFTKNIGLNIPIASSAMDTVTESLTAITMAQDGGIGIIHKNLSIEKQAKEVLTVKRYESGVVSEPVTVSPEDTLENVKETIKKYGFSGFPVVNGQGQIVGIVTNRDIRYVEDGRTLVKDIMTDRENMVLAEEVHRQTR